MKELKMIFNKMGIVIGVFAILILSSCEGDLEPQTFDVIDPNTFFKTDSDASALTNTVYNRTYGGWTGTFLNYKGSFIGDMVAGQMFIIWTPPTWVRLNDFSWSAVSQEEYAETYWESINGISYATSVLTQFENFPESDQLTRYKAEVRALRAIMAFWGYDLYGGLPLVVDAEIIADPFTEYQPDRWSNGEMESYIESELLAAEADLLTNADVTGTADYGRVTVETSKMLRLKLYMMQKDWAKAEAVSQEIISAGFTLQPSVREVFDVANEGNNEIIWAQPRVSDTSQGGISSYYTTSSVPGGFSLPGVPTVSGWGGLRVPFESYDAFGDGDTRRELFPIAWLDGDGNMVDFRANGTLQSGALFFKFGSDPDRMGAAHGTDFIYFRLADAMLLRAEALNEISPMSAEAIQLVQQVRDRSNAGPIPATVVDQASLRDFILEERRRELIGEGWARQDLIRHGRFLEFAADRVLEPVDAPSDKHLLFPIPQDAINLNPGLQSQQNPGY